jgi:predicted oxidoreductase (fatty acid repression mutant protein)
MASETPRGHPTPYRAESIDAFLEMLQRRRSIRSGFLRDKPVPDELIEKILEAARWAPSAGNSQPWEFLVIRDLEIRERLWNSIRLKCETRSKSRRRRAASDTA